MSIALPRPSLPGGLARNLAAVALGAMLVAGGVSALLVPGLRAPETSSAAHHDVSRLLLGRALILPGDWVRRGFEGDGLFASEVMLEAPFRFDDVTANVEITLLPRSRARESAGLLQTVYLHRFAPETGRGPDGLVGKRLEAGDGFGGETVWYDPLAARPFVAKCIEALDASRPARCLRTVELGAGMAAVYAFDAPVLVHWRAFDTEAQRILRQIGAL